MNDFGRRDVLKLGAGALAGTALTASGLWVPRAYAQEVEYAQSSETMSFEPEQGAELRVLRWAKFVDGDERLWMENTKKFTEQTGINVRVDSESWEDVRPKAAVAANIGSGPDIILGWFDDPHQYPDKLVDLTDLAEYLGNKYGGWYDVCRRYGTLDGEQWVGLPLGAAGARLVYRRSWMQEAGFEEFPQDLDGMLQLCKALNESGHPPGFALGHAVGDGNGWLHWLLWAHGGKVVDDDNQVVLSSPETVQALEYARELYQTFVPGTESWLDPNNNKAFLANQVSLTNNGISIYYAAKNSEDPAVKEMAEDIYHATFPVGPVGQPSELHLFTQAMAFNYSRYPQAAKEYLRFMWEAEQYAPWQQAAIGYVTQPLKAYEKNPIWTEDPKHEPYRDCVARMLWNGYSGDLGYASAATMADYIVVDMFAQAASGQMAPQDAADMAARRAERYYRV